MTGTSRGPSPKVELHVHLEGTIRPATLLAIARRNGEPLPADDEAGLARLFRFTDMESFIRTWIATTNCLRTRDDFRQVVVDYAAEVVALGAVYLEAIFSAAERVERGLAWDDVFSGYCDGAVEARERYGLEIRFTPDLYRGVDPALAEESARVAVRYRDRGVVGFGIGGHEAGRSVAPYARAFEIARDGGLGLVPHAGESAGPDSVREVLAHQPVRLRHGIAAAGDPALLAEIVDRGVVLDVCPTSNLRTGAVRSLAGHPLPALLAAGARCTVSSDDPAFFGTDLAREYEIAESLGLPARRAFENGVAGALCEPELKQRLRQHA